MIQKCFQFIKLVCCTLLLWGGGLQADYDITHTVYASYGVTHYDSKTNSYTLSTNVGWGEGTTTSGQWLFVISTDYTSITTDSTFKPIATGTNMAGLFRVWSNNTVDSFTNEGTIVLETGDVIRVGTTNGNAGEIGEIINTGTMTADKAYNTSYSYGYAINVNNTGKVGKVINEGTMGKILVDGYIGTIENSKEMDDITNSGTIGNSESQDITVIANDGTMGSITNNSTIYGNITNTGTITSITNSGTIDSITNGENGTMGSITSTGSISTITNSGTMSAISYTNDETTLNLYNTGTINLNSNITAGNTYVQIYGSNMNINITEYYFTINEDSEEFNSFSGYESASDDTSSHLTIGVTDSGINNNGTTNITLGTLMVDVSEDYYGENYLLSNLVVLYDDSGNLINLEDYSNYGISADTIYNAITLSDGLEYAKLRTTEDSQDDSFSIYKRSNAEVKDVIDSNFKKYSPAQALYKNNILTIDTLLRQSESIIYNTSYQRYGFRNTNALKKDDVIIKDNTSYTTSNNTNTAQTSDSTSSQTYTFNDKISRYNTDEVESVVVTLNQDSSSNEDIESNVIESSDDYFFFSPFVSHHSLYGKNEAKGDGLSYGFISGYNKEIGNSLIGFHLGFDYGNIDENNNIAYFDIDSISVLLGIHYRYDFSNGMYIKARGDVYYIYNSINDMYAGSYSAINYTKQHPDTLGFNLGITTGKQWNITDKHSALYGIFNIEGGISYQGLNNTSFTLNNVNYNNTQYSETYKDSFFNLLYINLDTKYDKMLGDNWTLNMALGVKVLVTPLPEAKIAALSNSGNTFNVSSKVYTNRVFGNAMLGVDYRVNDNVSLLLNYLGIYGDQSMSNSGFFNISVWW